MAFGYIIPTIVVGAMTKIPKHLLLSVDKEKKSLTVSNAAKWAAIKRGFKKDIEDPDYYYLFNEDKDNLYVPRNHTPVLRSDLIRGKDYKLVTPDFSNRKAKLGVDQVKLGPNDRQPANQQPAFDALVKPLAWPYSKILALRCGYGKSVVALKAAHHRQLRTLWVTVNTLLIEQIKPEIEACLGIPAKDIGHIQANKQNWKGREIAVAMLHTLAAREYTDEFWDYWGLVIFDEGDILGVNTFSKIAGKFSGERWMLTATPQRDDRMDVLFDKHVGPVCYKNLEYDLKPDCYIVKTGVDSKCAYKSGWDSVRREQRIHFAVTAKNLLFNDERHALLLSHVEKATEHGRTCLVLGDSVDGLVYAYGQARKTLANRTHSLIVGKVKQKDRPGLINASQVVWANSRLAYRGLDRQAFDTLIIATVIGTKTSFWLQAIGRILRYKLDKKPPIVVLLVDDTIGPVASLAAKIIMIFKKAGWPMHNADSVVDEYKARIKALRDSDAMDMQDRRHG